MAATVALQLAVLVRAQGVVADGVLLQPHHLLGVAVVVLDDGVAVVLDDRVPDVFAVAFNRVVLHFPICWKREN